MIIKKIKTRQFRIDPDWLIAAAFIALLLVVGAMDMQDIQQQTEQGK